MDDVIDVFVNEHIAIQLTKSAVLNEALVATLLAKEEVTVQEIVPSREYVQ